MTVNLVSLRYCLLWAATIEPCRDPSMVELNDNTLSAGRLKPTLRVERASSPWGLYSLPPAVPDHRAPLSALLSALAGCRPELHGGGRAHRGDLRSIEPHRERMDGVARVVHGLQLAVFE